MVVGEVQHDLVVLERFDPIFAFADVAFDQLHPGGQRRRPVMRRRREVVQNGDLVPLLEEQLAGALTNKTGPAGDQHLHCWGL